MAKKKIGASKVNVAAALKPQPHRHGKTPPGGVHFIPDVVRARIIELSTTHSHRGIVEMLISEGVKVSKSGIGKILRAEDERVRLSAREAETALTKENRRLIDAHLSKTVESDLELLQSIRDQLNRWRQGLDDDGLPHARPLGVTQRLAIVDRLNKVLDTRIKLSGSDGLGRLAQAAESWTDIMERSLTAEEFTTDTEEFTTSDEELATDSEEFTTDSDDDSESRVGE